MLTQFGWMKSQREDKRRMKNYRRLPHAAQLEERPIASVRIETEADLLGTLGVENVDAPLEDPL